MCVGGGVTRKEVSASHPPEVNGSGSQLRIEVLDQDVELVGKGGGAERDTTRAEPESKGRVSRVFAEVGPHSLLEELYVGKELGRQRQVVCIDPGDLFITNLHDHLLLIPLKVVHIEVHKDLLSQTTTKVEHHAHETPLEKQGSPPPEHHGFARKLAHLSWSSDLAEEVHLSCPFLEEPREECQPLLLGEELACHTYMCVCVCVCSGKGVLDFTDVRERPRRKR